MSTQGAEASIIIQARDRATGQFRKVAAESGRLGNAWRILGAVLRRLNVGMLAMATVLPVIGAALASIVTVGATVSFLKFEQSARRARIQLQFMGFSASESRQQMDMLASTMGRANAQVMFQSAQAMSDIAIAGQGMTAQLIPMADTFAELIGASPADTFSALFDIFTKQDPAKFVAMIAGTEKLAINAGMIAAIKEGDFAPFIKWLEAISDKEKMTQIEILGDNLERIGALGAPAAKVISEGTAMAANVMVDSLATRLEALKDKTQTILVGALVGLWIGSWNKTIATEIPVTNMRMTMMKMATAMSSRLMAILPDKFAPPIINALNKVGTGLGTNASVRLAFETVGRGLAGRIAFGLGAALLTALVLDFRTTVAEFLESPETSLFIGISAAILGIATGKAWVAALVAIVGMELYPGISGLLETLSTDTKFAAFAGLVGIALGLVFKKNFITSIALGATLADIFKKLYSGEGEGATLKEGITKVAVVALGAAIGFGLTKQWTGAIFGAGVATAIYDSISEPEVKAAFTTAGLAYVGFMVAGWPGFFAGALIGTVISMESSEVREAFKNFGIWLGKSIVNGMSMVFNDFIGLVNDAIAMYNRVTPGPNIPKIPEIPIMELPGVGDVNAPTIADLVPKLPFVGPMPNIPVPGATGVPVPGFPTPYEQYKERKDRERFSYNPFQSPDFPYNPTSQSGSRNGATIVQLMMNQRLMGEVLIDELGRVSQFQGGFGPGSVAGA